MELITNHTDFGGRPAIAVVADDLTGAADTAIQFLPPGRHIWLLEADALRPDEQSGVQKAAFGWALNTVSRAAGENDCREAVEKAARLISREHFRLIYKKVDSQMRGRPGLEIETLRRTLGLDCAFIAPALPEQGRLTRNGVHLVHGVPVALAEAGRDPVTPVRESDLVRLVSDQSGASAALVSWQVLDQGMDRVIDRIESIRAAGAGLIVFDVLHRDHLNLAARIGLDHYPRALLAGSAGLAQSAAEHLGIRPAPISDRLPDADRLLFVCGSQSRVLRHQADILAASGKVDEVVVSPEGLSDGARWADLIHQAVRMWEKKNLIIRLSEKTFDLNPSDLLDPLSDLALTLIRAQKPDGLFLSGGDTARSVLLRSRVGAVNLKGQADLGVAWSDTDQGDLRGMTLVTKSGAFGRDNLLLDVYNKWIKDNKNGK